MTATAAIDLDIWSVFDEIGYRPHSAQIPVHQSNARNRVVAGGRRTGKSEIGGHELVPEAVFTFGVQNELKESGKRREFWIIGPQYTDAEKEFRIVWNELKRFGFTFDRPGSYNDPIHGSLHLSCFNGLYQVHGKSAMHPDTLVGEGLTGVIMAEAAKLKERVWTKFIRPTLADFQGWALFSSTPEGKNWFYDKWRDGQDPNMTEWDSWRIPSWMNPHVYKTPTRAKDVERAIEIKRLPKLEARHHDELNGMIIDKEIRSLLLDLTPEMFKSEIGADFTEFVGRVFKEFDEEVHVKDLEFNPRWETYACVDYGFTNPTVWLLLQVGPFGNVHILREYYERGKTTAEAGAEILARGLAPKSIIKFYVDPASPGDSKELSEILKLPYLGGGATGGLLNDRIVQIRKALRPVPEHLDDDHPEKIPQLLFDRSCKETIRDFNDYRYPKSMDETVQRDPKNPSEAPLKKDDHAPEALGRFFAGRFAYRTNNQDRRTTVRRSTLG